MTTQAQNFWRIFRRRGRRNPQATAPELADVPSPLTPAPEIAPDDPLVAHFQDSPGPTDVDRLDLDSPALRALGEAGTKIAVPLISQGELIGLLNLGPRLSQ